MQQKSERSAKGAVFAGFLKILTPIIIIVPGIIAYYLYGASALGNNGDDAYPMIVANVMPTALLGFFAAVMFGAILSSYNSVLNSASTIYALDVHKPMFAPEAEDARLVKIGQKFGLIVAIFSQLSSHRLCSIWAVLQHS